MLTADRSITADETWVQLRPPTDRAIACDMSRTGTRHGLHPWSNRRRVACQSDWRLHLIRSPHHGAAEHASDHSDEKNPECGVSWRSQSDLPD